MSVMPKKRSWSWAWVCGIHAAVLIAAFLVSRAALHLALTMQILFSLAILSLSLALIAAVGGWIGGRLFFLCSAAGTLIGAAYMLYVCFADAAPGWGDLASIVGFLFLSVIGIGAGLLAELIRFLIIRNKSKQA